MVISKKLTCLVLFIFILTLIPIATAEKETDCVYYFYGSDCKLCSELNSFIQKLESKYPTLTINKYEVYYNKSNWMLLDNYFDAYDVSSQKQGVPVVFLSNTYFIGPKSIKNFLESSILSNKDQECPSLQKKATLGIVGEKSPKNLIEALTFFTVTGHAIVDGFTPSALAVILIMLMILLTLTERKKILLSGSFFIIAVFIATFLFGIGLLNISKLTRASYFFSMVIAILAIIFGAYKIKTYFLPKVANLSLEKQPKLKKVVTWLISPVSSFAIGFIVSLFSLVCVGRIGKIISNLIVEKSTKWVAFPWLLWWSLIFVLPLIIVLFLINKWMKNVEEKISKHKSDIHRKKEKQQKVKIKLLQFVFGAIIFVLGIVILFLL